MSNQNVSLKDMLQETIEERKGTKRPGWKYVWHEDFVLENGRQYYVISFPTEFKKAAGKMKDCYRNAFYLAEKYPDKLTYVEGFAVSAHCPYFPTLHAWCTDGNNAIDPTWRNSGFQYYGVAFNFSYVRKTIVEKGSFGVMDNWKDKYPLLRGVEDGWRI